MICNSRSSFDNQCDQIFSRWEWRKHILEDFTFAVEVRPTQIGCGAAVCSMQRRAPVRPAGEKLRAEPTGKIRP